MRPALVPSRRWRATAAAAVLAALAGACASPSPPVELYQLRIAAPAPVPPPASRADVWELSGRVGLPGYLDREAIVVADGSSGLQALDGHRWAEPLRDSVPRVLRHDLALLRGAGRVWEAPAPPGVAVARTLRVDVLALQAGADRRSLQLEARWWLVDPDGRTPPAGGSAALDVPIEGTGVDAIAAAHCAALWQLAQRIASAP
jgi:uncharacterized lipoprotein YmbA